jgi:hypothetical protein
MKLRSLLSDGRRLAGSCRAATAVVVLATTLGCSRTSSEPGDSSSSSSSAPAPPAESAGLVNELPVSDQAVKAAVNPKGAAPYTGPVGGLRGRVTITGDPPSELPELVAKIPDKCKVARTIYGRLFREGLMRSVGDALVTVTGYDGYLPAKQDAVRVVGRDCAWDRLTIGMMFGQRLEVSSRGSEPYMPALIGAPAKAMMVAVPRGAPVKLYPPKPGRYTLADRIHSTMVAELYVLKYPTFDVTGLDGRYEITGIPVGDVSVTAFLPAIGKTAQKKVRIEADQKLDLDLELQFDAKRDLQRREPEAPSAPDAAPAAPAPSR